MRILKTGIIFLYLIIICFPGHSQDRVYIDSLRALLPDAPDSSKYLIFRKIGRALTDTHPEESNTYLANAMRIALKSGNLKSIANTSSAIGINYMFNSQYDSSYIFFNLAIENYGKLGDTLQMVISTENLAIAYQRDNRLDNAIETYYQVIKAADQIQDWEGMTTSRINVASLLIDQESYDRAIFHLKEIQKIYYDLDEGSEGRQIIQNYSPNFYINLGIAYEKLKQPDTALFYFNTSLKLSKQIGEDYVAAHAQNSIGNYHRDQKQDWQTALTNYQEALDGFSQMQDNRGIVTTKNGVGYMNFKLGNYETANRLLIETKDLAESIDFKEELRNAYKYLSENEEARGNYQSSLNYYQQHVAIKEILFSEARDKTLQELERQYQTEKQVAEIAQLDAENKLQEKQKTFQLIIFIVSVLTLMGIGYTLYTRYKLRKQREAAEFEHKVNVAMNRFVPNEFIETLGRKHIMQVELGDQVEKIITILFTDIRSYTTISEGMTPTEIFQFVKRYAERMGPIILRNGGFINQYLGDGIMAIFKNSPDDCLNACIEMQETLKSYNEELVADGLNPIRVGMGMHTGPLVMGIIGDEERRDVALISDTVNTAARMESITKDYKSPILISEDSLQLIHDPSKYLLRGLGSVLVKGKNKAVPIYECYNIDESGLQENKSKTSEIFDKGISAYMNNELEKARGIFSSVILINPADEVSQSFIEKCEKKLAS